MMLIRFTFYFLISFTILSIPVNKKTIFTHLHPHTAPYTSRVFIEIADSLKRGLEKGKQIFLNSEPSHAHTDKVKSSQAAILNKKVKIPAGNFTAEEKELLKKALSEEN